MRDKFQKIENHWFWIWIKDNAVQLKIIGAISAFVIGTLVTILVLPLINKQNQETLTNKKPNVKIASVSYKGQLYPESPTTQSEALNFFIAIRNEGDANAYDVQIKKKILVLPRGAFDLKTPSLQTPTSSTRFDLPERKIIMDSIFIDENPIHMQKVRIGEKPITLEYEIIYYGDRHKQIGPFVYKYKNSTINGVFGEGTAEESLNIKP